MNVLLTGAGRRNFLVHFFRAALGSRGRVIACDASPTAPALAEADQVFIVPSMDHPDYFSVLRSICQENGVRLIVPVNDLEIPGLSRNAARFHEVGAIPLVPPPDVVATCSDKWSAFLWLRSLGIATPETFATIESVREALERGTVRFPLLIKPRWGSSSIGIELVENQRELELAYEWSKIQLGRTIVGKMTKTDPDHAFIFQERIEGKEYGMDVVNDLRGNYAATLVRRKLAMRAGNTDRAVTVGDPYLESLGRMLSQHMRHVGSVDCDVMVGEGGRYVLDVNPRLGGGYPFSHMAGANLPAALVAWAEGAEPDPAWLRYREGVTSSKYDGVAVADRSKPEAPSPMFALGQDDAPRYINGKTQ
ncbi:MAG: ATP-grasp domain-containing protein [Acidobacteriia bacterium]|nr:ATP-grasp domain-containing protein [Terriglobia bacterium]